MASGATLTPPRHSWVVTFVNVGLVEILTCRSADLEAAGGLAYEVAFTTSS